MAIDFRPSIDDREIAAVTSVLTGRTLVHGPVTEKFETEFAARLQVKHAVAVSSCTAGLYLLSLSGETWKVPALTHPATANALELGARKIGAWLDGPVWHHRGPDHALHIDTPPMGKAAVYSFYATKNMTSVEGGMVCTNDAELAAKIQALRSFAYVRDTERPWLYDISTVAMNLRMSELHAAVGLVQLHKLDGFQKLRQRNALALADMLSSMEAEVIGDYYAMNVYVAERDRIIGGLREQGVMASVHYPMPVPLMKHYRERYMTHERLFPVSLDLSRRLISLPIGPHLDLEDMKTMADTLKGLL